MRTKTITILIAGAIFTAGFMMGFGEYVFAGDPAPGLEINIEQIPGGRVSDQNYNSSFSNKSIGQIRMEVGNVLMGYGIGGAGINKVTDALEGGGVYEAELKSFLIAIGMNEQDTQNILLEFNKLGIGSNKESTQGVSTPDAIGTSPSAADGTIKSILPSNPEVSTPGTGDVSPSAADGTIKSILPGKRAESAPAVTPDTGDAARALVHQELHRPPTGFIKLGDLPGKRAAFEDSAIKSIKDLKAAESKEQRENARKELQANREIFQTEILSMNLSIRENAKMLRENFRENMKTTIGHVDHGKTARIAVAHGKGLRMVNRYRSAIARFDHILGRLESRVEKIENEAQARSSGTLKNILPSAILLIEEAKNTQALNKAKLAELQAKYESLLMGENSQGIGEEAREIAKELKAEIEKLHAKLHGIPTVRVEINF